MSEGYDLLVTKIATGIQKSMVDDYGSGVVSYDYPSTSVKDPTKTEWQEHDGEDVYIPEDGLKIEGADLTVKLCYTGAWKSWPSAMEGMLKFMLGGMVSLHDCYTDTDWSKCYFKSLEDIDIFSNESCGDVVQYSIKFRLTNFTQE